MAPVTSPSTVTLASDTRWINAITRNSFVLSETHDRPKAVVDVSNKRGDQPSSSLPGFSYSPRQAVVSAPSKTTNQLRFTNAQTNRMNIGANNEWLTQPSSSLPGFSYSPRQAVVSAPNKTTSQLR
ncbi:hypothetical protein D3C78_1629050 [compost metagenome]